MESTDAGCDHTLFSLTSAAAVTCAIMNPEFSPAPGARKGGKPFVERRIHHPLQAALGDARQSAERDGQEVERKCQRLAVEVAARDDGARNLRAQRTLGSADLFLLREDQRIVDGGVHLDLEHLAAVRKRVAHRSVDLRDTAHRIGILHRLALAMRLANDAALQHAAEVFRHQQLAGMRPGVLDTLVKGDVGALQRVDGERSDHVGSVGKHLGLQYRQQPIASMP